MKVVTNVPLTIDDKSYPAGEEIDVSDEVAHDLRSAGKVALPFDPKTQQEGNYTSSTGRSAVSGESTHVAQTTSKQPDDVVNAPEKPKK